MCLQLLTHPILWRGRMGGRQGIPHYKIIISSHYDFYFEMPNKNHMVARPSRIRAKNNYMVTWPSRFRRKIIIVWHCPAGSPEKIIVWHWPAGPAPEFPHKMVGHCVSPCGEPAKKLYGSHTGKIIWRHLACFSRKIIIVWHWPAGPSEKKL